MDRRPPQKPAQPPAAPFSQEDQQGGQAQGTAQGVDVRLREGKVVGQEAGAAQPGQHEGKGRQSEDQQSHIPPAPEALP